MLPYLSTLFGGVVAYAPYLSTLFGSEVIYAPVLFRAFWGSCRLVGVDKISVWWSGNLLFFARRATLFRGGV